MRPPPHVAPGIVGFIACVAIYLFLVLIFASNHLRGHRRNFYLALRLPYFLNAELLTNTAVVVALAIAQILPRWVSRGDPSLAQTSHFTGVSG